MTAHIDPLSLFFLPTKYSLENLSCSLLLMAFLFLSISFFHWYHPGGPAWGKYYSSYSYSYSWITKPSNFPTKIPGPKGLPLIGSISLMSSPLAHRRFAASATACNARRLMAFSLGYTRVVVTCHPDVAKQILHSSVFADRPVKESAYSLMFNRAIGFAPYGVYWRTLRRIAANHLFSPKQIKSSECVRSEIVAHMVGLFGSRSDHNNGFRVRHVLKTASLSHMMSSVFGKRYGLDDQSNREMEELSGLVEEGYHLLGALNLGDHLPWLLDFDPQRIRFRCSQLVPKVNRFVSKIIADHRAHPTKTNRDFVDVLLSLPGPDKLSDSDMIAVLWEMIFRGTDTVAVLTEWILARMVLHPSIQSRVQAEVDEVVGKSRGVVTEADVASMVYLQATVKEVLRLHPPGPLLSWARLAITDTTIDRYHVPKGTTAMVNMWAIARDPQVWSDPLEFKPQRFVATKESGGCEFPEFSILGSDLRLAPFGSGRRTCPGKTLGLATVSYWVASLLHEFEWLPSDQNGVDLTEVLKLSCEMASPLTVKVRPRR